MYAVLDAEGDLVMLRKGEWARIEGRGIFGGILVGRGEEGQPLSWHQTGSYRWDGEDHPNDIIKGLPDPLPRNIVT